METRKRCRGTCRDAQVKNRNQWKYKTKATAGKDAHLLANEVSGNNSRTLRNLPDVWHLSHTKADRTRPSIAFHATQDMHASQDETTFKEKETVRSPTIDSNCSIQSSVRVLAQSSSQRKGQTTLQFKKRKQRWPPSSQDGQKCNAPPPPPKRMAPTFPSTRNVRVSLLQWCCRLEAVMRHKHIFKADTVDLAASIHHRFLTQIAIAPPCAEVKIPTVQDQIYILASLWIAIKLVENQSFVPGSFFMGKVSDVHPELVRRAEMAIAMTLQWKLVGPASEPG